MSFIKIQKINPNTILSPDAGNIYLGQDNIGLWEKDEFGNITYVQSGNTYNTFLTGSTSSGTSGINGTSGSSGKDGTFLGSSGTSGKTGFNGTTGTSGSSGNSSAGTSGKSGSSGTSGKTGTSGTSSIGTSGTSGENGIDGTDGNGTAGTSGSSGFNGGYGGSTRLWIFTGDTTPNQNHFNAYNNTYLSNDLSLIEYIRINQRDADNQDVDGWLNTWDTGLLKIENRRNAGIFGIYIILSGTTKIGLDIYQLSGFSISSGNGNLVDGDEYLISFVNSVGDINFYSGSGSSGTGSSGTSGVAGSSGTSGVGQSGSSGTSGVGQSGSSGTSGISVSGTDGSSGTSGVGQSGSSGTSGSAGTSGSSPSLFSWVIDTPEIGGVPGPRLFYDMTTLRVDSYCVTGTSISFNIEDRSVIGSIGTVIYSTTTTTLGVSSVISVPIINGNWLWLDITDSVGIPEKLVVSLALKIS